MLGIWRHYAENGRQLPSVVHLGEAVTKGVQVKSEVAANYPTSLPLAMSAILRPALEYGGADRILEAQSHQSRSRTETSPGV
jgi:hypothetical protein